MQRSEPLCINFFVLLLSPLQAHSYRDVTFPVVDSVYSGAVRRLGLNQRCLLRDVWAYSRCYRRDDLGGVIQGLLIIDLGESV